MVAAHLPWWSARLRDHALELAGVAEDGNCVYAAVALMLSDHGIVIFGEEPHRLCRRLLKAEKRRYRPLLDACDGWKNVLADMKIPGRFRRVSGDLAPRPVRGHVPYLFGQGTRRDAVHGAPPARCRHRRRHHTGERLCSRAAVLSRYLADAPPHRRRASEENISVLPSAKWLAYTPSYSR